MICFEPGQFGGRYGAPPSKPVSQRLLVAGGIADGKTSVGGVDPSDDVWAVLRGLAPISAVDVRLPEVTVFRKFCVEPSRVVDVGESGFALRVLTALYSAIDGTTLIVTRGRLGERPMDDLLEALRGCGARVERVDGNVIVVGTRVRSCEATIRGDVSSQYISALMYMGSLLEGGATVRVVGPRESWQYVELTGKVLSMFGVDVEVGETVRVSGAPRGAGYVAVPGDWALSAFLMVAAAITGGEVTIEGLDPSWPADMQIVDVLRSMGTGVDVGGGGVTVSGRPRRPADVDVSNAPDLAPPIALAMAFVDGRSVLRGVGRLRLKESDRVSTIVDVLARMGVDVEVHDNAIAVAGPPKRGGVTFAGHGDHRIAFMAMAASVALGGCVEGWDAALKSSPTLLRHFLGHASWTWADGAGKPHLY